MDEKQMLLMAAKAAGAVSTQEAKGGGLFVQWSPNLRGYRLWDPLADDGDALRLSNACNLAITQITDGRCKPFTNVLGYTKDGRLVDIYEDHGEDQDAATRLAIVRAAAEVGAGMRPFPTAEEIRRDWGGEDDTAVGEQSNG